MKPHFGHSHGLPVHHRAIDHLPDHSLYARLNKAVAVKITAWVGSMTCAWIFCLLALLSLPAVLTQAFRVNWFPGWLVAVGLIALVAWIAQTFLQLVLLSVIMVGQNVQQAASDARAAKTFDDCEMIADRLDTHTQGGITEILAAVAKLGDQVAVLGDVAQKVMAARLEHESGVAADAKAARSAAESAFVATQALAAVATAKPGAGELAAAVRESTEAVRQVHQAVTAPPEAPDPGPSPAGGPGTSGSRT